jgi:hypothetical protein
MFGGSLKIGKGLYKRYPGANEKGKVAAKLSQFSSRESTERETKPFGSVSD